MKNYCIDYRNCNKYNAIVYASSYINPFENLVEINKDISDKVKQKCFILFDLLLTNGDNFNRFVEAYYDGNAIVEDTIKVVSISSELEDINSHYKGRNTEVNNSVLSPGEKYRILRM